MTGPGFAIFDLTRQIKTLLNYNQSFTMFFITGEDVALGTHENGKPAELIIV
jgi:hypothetical protein